MSEKEIETVKQDAEPVVTDFLEEFKDALFHQLISDHARWGNTWLDRPKEGQELRTKARYTDYFDMFEQAGTPVPWLKIIGGALICWIREQHPELFPDVNDVIAEDMKAMGFREGGELIGISVSPEGVKNIVTPILHDLVPAEKPVEEMTTKELVESEPPILKQAELLGHMIESAALTNPIAHIVNEKVEKSGLGKLSYSPRSESDGKIILDSIVFTKANVKEYPDEAVMKLGTCDKDGCIIPASKAVGVLGRVSSNGQYRLSLVNGVGPDDVIFVSYTYEFLGE